MIRPNGAGKSTLINMIAGAIRPTEGKIISHGGVDEHKIGVCFKDNVMINELSLREHFELFVAYRRIQPHILEDSIEYFASNMKISHMMNNRENFVLDFHYLEILLLFLMDDPTADVDVQARQLIWKMISGLKYSTLMIISHALEEAEAVLSRLFIVAGGKVPFTGTSTEMREKYKYGYILRVERMEQLELFWN